ncbi:hypothetical protein [Pectinatus brassicae]|uniref:Uncharacterized protein n=1 Tax=Pectinatus brassicae TaxID=862415 RepID=A0A840UIN8_9FIRM|nr:hypothetical protein [Pectinatus brassicae]MBB5335457.1 hypothetical protein [Pectinatus brassicae]
MTRKQKNVLNQNCSIKRRITNFIMNFFLALVWLIRSMIKLLGKYLRD